MWFQNDAEFVIEVDPGETDLFRSLFASLCPFLHSLEEFVQRGFQKYRGPKRIQEYKNAWKNTGKFDHRVQPLILLARPFMKLA